MAATPHLRAMSGYNACASTLPCRVVGDPRLGTRVGTWLDAAAVDEYLQRLGNELKRFTDRVGDRLPRARYDLYERLLSAAPRLLTRYHSHRNITIVQGVWNC